MQLCIDASNIRAGGGVAHLAGLLGTVDSREYGFREVVVWAGSATLARLEERPWLHKVRVPLLDRSLPARLYWQRVLLDRSVRQAKGDLLFIPGGLYVGFFRPFVTMSQNLIPFQWSEMKRYGLSGMFFRNLLLCWAQTRTFRACDGLIFLTRYARDVVMERIGTIRGRTTIIPHGVDQRFLRTPRPQKEAMDFSFQRPFRLLYVSSIDMYKHPWNVVEAVARLRRSGYPVQLDLIGAAYPAALRRLRRTLSLCDRQGDYIRYHGKIPYSDLFPWYHQANLFIFASSCETFGQIVTEAMAAGLAIACSAKGPMKELLADTGEYFNPEEPSDIAAALKKMIDAPALRAQKAQAAYSRVQAYSWRRCAQETFAFLAGTAKGFRQAVPAQHS